MIHTHDRVREQFQRITESWPEPTDVQKILDNLPDLEPPDLSAYAREVMAAIGGYQRAKARGRRKKSGQSQSAKRPSDIAIVHTSLDHFPRCA